MSDPVKPIAATAPRAGSIWAASSQPIVYPGAASAGGPVAPEPTVLGFKQWLSIIGIATVATLTTLGGGAWLHANLDRRVDRVEDGAKSDIKEIRATLSDIRVQLAVISAKQDAGQSLNREQVAR